MDQTLVVIIVIAAFVGFFLLKYLLGKGVSAAAKAVTTKVIYKDEYKTERQLISETLTFDTVASVDKVMQQLTLAIDPTQDLHAIKPAFHELARNPNMIAYSYQNKFYEHFAAIVQFKTVSYSTLGTFDFLRWKENDGMLVGADAMKLLRQKVWTAFADADPSVKVTGAPSVDKGSMPKIQETVALSEADTQGK